EDGFSAPTKSKRLCALRVLCGSSFRSTSEAADAGEDSSHASGVGREAVRRGGVVVRDQVGWVPCDRVRRGRQGEAGVAESEWPDDTLSGTERDGEVHSC